MIPVFDVIVCGSLHIDIIVNGPHLPRLDETVVGSQWRKVCGGKGGNQAVMAAKAGAKCAMIGRVGTDDLGEALLANLISNSVNTDHVSRDPLAGTGMSVAIVETTGDYGAVIVSGSNLSLSPDAIAISWQALGGAKVLILQNEIREVANIAAAKAAKSAGATVVLNAAPMRQLSNELLSRVDLLVVNRIEAEMMNGNAVSDKVSAFAALRKLRAKSRDVIITLGGQGLVYCVRDQSPQFIKPHKVTVKSTHGAGDSFVGALAHRLAAGADHASACAYANWVAANFVAGRESN